MASVTVTVYVPAGTEDKSSVIASLLHEYLYGVVPPLTVNATEPVPPLHNTWVGVALAVNAAGMVTTISLVLVFPQASFTVTVTVCGVVPGV